MKIRFNIFLAFFIAYCSLCSLKCFAQDVIDVVDPYEMKVSRSKEADTFYFSQNAVASQKVKMDTLRTYDVFLEERPTPFGKAYMCNGTEVTKQKFADYKLLWNASAACKPCMLYTYSDKDELEHVAFQYEDCLCGSFVEYYPEGGKKVEGKFMENPTGNWQNMKSRDLCNIRSGIWTYYLPNGMVEKTENYVDGKLKSVTNANIHTTASKTTGTEAVDGATETVQRKGFLQKMKDRNKQTNN